MSIQAPVHYQIAANQFNGHIFDIKMTVSTSEQSHCNVSLPSWIPGSYMIRDFAKNIVSINAYQLDGRELALEKLDKQTWRINNNKSGFELTYQVYAFDTSVRTAYLDQFRGFINGTSAFIKVPEFENSKHTVEILKPDALPHWQLATGLTREDSGDMFDFGTFSAPNYLELIDYPFEMSDFSTVRFDVYDIPHYVVISGVHNADTDRIAKDLTPICQHHLDYFEKPYPIDQYLFMVNVVGDGFGGLEHLNSTALLCGRSTLPTAQDPSDKISDEYQTFLSLSSHEYFHTWNVKRIRPAEFINPNIGTETYTRQLWFYEGITSYIDDWSLNQTELVDANQYLNVITKTLQRLENCQGRFVQSTVDSSFDAWTKFYKQDENATNAIVSYYVKGAVAALCFDLLLRKETNQEDNLQTIMRDFWQDWAKGDYQGTHYSSFIDKVQALLKLDVTEQFKAWLEGTEDIPIANFLAEFGVELTKVDLKPRQLELGINVKPANLGINIINVATNSAAMHAGLSANDNLIAINQQQITTANWQAVLASVAHLEKVTIHGFRRDELFTTTLNTSSLKAKQEIKLKIVDEDKAKLWLKRVNK
ncbi:M61 family metallopeptidase [Catenovulum sp. SM1970]|uniref:M61 family metallopeptidase n=1 Tax=Marinifaba aquimaris TaxID=2741323 RepID=UPI001574ACF4|nr:PDZ domain-containing protein [Marinifaba aquimaris]NTS78163.1 M61 family metallopeptidase [Marinifaba aquimaris]